MKNRLVISLGMIFALCAVDSAVLAARLEHHPDHNYVGPAVVATGTEALPNFNDPLLHQKDQVATSTNSVTITATHGRHEIHYDSWTPSGTSTTTITGNGSGTISSVTRDNIPGGSSYLTTSSDTATAPSAGHINALGGSTSVTSEGNGTVDLSHATVDNLYSGSKTISPTEKRPISHSIKEVTDSATAKRYKASTQ